MPSAAAMAYDLRWVAHGTSKALAQIIGHLVFWSLGPAVGMPTNIKDFSKEL